MRITEPTAKGPMRRSAGANRVRDILFKAALSDVNAPIVQRRSGKSRTAVQAPANGLLPLDLFFVEENHANPTDVLEAGRVTARAIAAALQEEKRLALARRFCTAVVTAYWFEVQRSYRSAWPLPDQFMGPSGDDLEEPVASLAKTLGTAAARLDPVLASYLIGVIYTTMLPDETRSRLGVYYTPPGLTRRLLERATVAGVDWKSCRVLDPACGGGAFLAPLGARIVSENRGLPARRLVNAIGERIHGFEIDPFSAWASQVFLEATLMGVCREAGQRLQIVVEICRSSFPQKR